MAGSSNSSCPGQLPRQYQVISIVKSMKLPQKLQNRIKPPNIRRREMGDLSGIE